MWSKYYSGKHESNQALLKALVDAGEFIGDLPAGLEQTKYAKRLEAAFNSVDRGKFVPKKHAVIGQEDRTYWNWTLPIGRGQTISQPSLVAKILNGIDLPHNNPDARVLEVGTGSGWSTGLTANMMGSGTLHSFDVVWSLVQLAKRNLRKVPLPKGVTIKIAHADPLQKLEGEYDRIIVHAAAPQSAIEILAKHLKAGGKLILPVGGKSGQELKLFTRKSGNPSDLEAVTIHPNKVEFVPLRGKHGFTPKEWR
jgi:protein-L-isoaspartate(D-aspartate) O-methyltransferase